MVTIPWDDGAMLPVAAGALDAGHNVTILAYDEYAAKVKPMIWRSPRGAPWKMVRQERGSLFNYCGPICHWTG